MENIIEYSLITGQGCLLSILLVRKVVFVKIFIVFFLFGFVGLCVILFGILLICTIAHEDKQLI